MEPVPPSESCSKQQSNFTGGERPLGARSSRRRLRARRGEVGLPPPFAPSPTRAPRSEGGSSRTHKGRCVRGSPFQPFSFDPLPDHLSTRNPTQGAPQTPAELRFVLPRAVRLRHVWVFHMQQMQPTWLPPAPMAESSPASLRAPPGGRRARARRRPPFVEVSAPRPATPSFNTTRRWTQTFRLGPARGGAQCPRPPPPRPLRGARGAGRPGTPGPGPRARRAAAEELKATTQRG